MESGECEKVVKRKTTGQSLKYVSRTKKEINTHDYDFENVNGSRKRKIRSDIEYRIHNHFMTVLLLKMHLIRRINVRSNIQKSRRQSMKKKATKKRVISKTKIKQRRILQRKKLLDRLDKESVQYKLLCMDKSSQRKITKKELSQHIISTTNFKMGEHKSDDGIWMLIHDLVFDISNVLENHPGGPECLIDCAGVNATRVFDDVGHSDIAWEMLENSLVGVIDEDDEKYYEDLELESNSDEKTEEELEEKRTKLVWNMKAFEYLSIFMCAMIALLCFIWLQHKKWDMNV